MIRKSNKKKKLFSYYIQNKKLRISSIFKLIIFIIFQSLGAIKYFQT